MDTVRVRSWVRSHQVQPNWLWHLGSAFLLIATLISLDVFGHFTFAKFTSKSYHWIFFFVPETAWVFIMGAAGAAMLYAAHTWNKPTWVQPFAIGLSVGLPMMWAAGFVAGLVTGYQTGNTATITWSLLALWSVQVTRHGG